LPDRGSAIDAASVLPAILNGIIDAIPTVEPLGEKITSFGGITQENAIKLENCVYLEYGDLRYVRASIIPSEVAEKLKEILDADELICVFGCDISIYLSDGTFDAGEMILISKKDDAYSISQFSV
jgi:hypothetical protein